MDRDEYKIDDKFQLTLKIIPSSERKKIRLYKNYKNLEISFSLVNSSKGVINDDWSKHSGQFLEDSEIVEMTIEKNNPFVKTFDGYIKDDDVMLTLTIPELKMEVSFDKHKVLAGASIRIGDSLEDYFEVKEIRIVEGSNPIELKL